MDEPAARRWPLYLAVVSLLLAGTIARAEGPQRAVSAGGSIDNDTVWSGTIAVERSVTVNAGVRLTVRPGARILFSDGAELTVAGTLRAEGTAVEPIRFLSAAPVPARGSWKGISLAGESGASILAGTIVTGAEAVRILAGAPEISGCTIENGVTGIFVGNGTAGKISGNRIVEMTGSGIDCQKGSTPAIDNNEIRNCRGFGVLGQKGAAPSISNNVIVGCDVGISYASAAPPASGNRIEKNRIGIGLNNVENGMTIIRNRFAGNETGLWVENFSSPRVGFNVFDNNGTGIFCFKSSSPEIGQNRIVHNRTGILCSQLSNPMIVSNELSGNGTGLFLTLSSYATVNRNNFDNNAVQIELGLMSHEWEASAGKKPERGSSARLATQAERLQGTLSTSGGAPPIEVAGTGLVDATENWWGEGDTAEMALKGADANIHSIVDGYDPTAKDYPGTFPRDRVDYRRWKRSPNADAGVPVTPIDLPANQISRVCAPFGP